MTEKGQEQRLDPGEGSRGGAAGGTGPEQWTPSPEYPAAQTQAGVADAKFCAQLWGDSSSARAAPGPTLPSCPRLSSLTWHWGHTSLGTEGQ